MLLYVTLYDGLPVREKIDGLEVRNTLFCDFTAQYVLRSQLKLSQLR